ncbi:hypothetical protein J23TS9_39930 [Paenibacillus sp. J23TS9]|nr:hypothetical protein J23TS9_39930 [Paenibacillus sp. J23TS9]
MIKNMPNPPLQGDFMRCSLISGPFEYKEANRRPGSAKVQGDGLIGEIAALPMYCVLLRKL